MPQEPKRRHSRERKGKRRASIKFNLPQVSYCSNCQKPTLPHHTCPSCGFYKGRQVLVIKESEKKEKKQPA